MGPLIYAIGVAVTSEYATRSIDKLIDINEKATKEISRRKKEMERLSRDAAKVDYRMLEKKKEEIILTEKYANANDKQKSKMLELLNKEQEELSKKNKLSKDEIEYEQTKGRIIALNSKAKSKGLTDDDKSQLAASQSIINRISTGKEIPKQPEEMLIEEQAIKASIAGHNNKSKAQQEAAQRTIQIEIEAQRQTEERIKAEGKEFDDSIKRKEEAMKSLAGFDERMRISSLDGEAQKQAQLLANYEKQKAEIEALHEAQLLYAENEEQIYQEQANRMLEMEMQYQEQCQAIKNEYAEMNAQRRQKEDEAVKAMAEQRKREEEELRDLKFQSAAASMSTIAQLTEGHKNYATLYKTTAMSEAIINAIQSVLKTMAGTPFPFNIPLASAQAAAAAVQVQKIAATKMYRGGIIPGMNTLIMANEQGREAILNPMAVRAIGGEVGVNALNNGTYNNYSYNNSRSSNIVIKTSIMTQKTYRDEIEPVLRRAERRR